MTLQEAIQNCGENWFRPIGWASNSIFYGQAFCKTGDTIWRMPDHKLDMTCNARFLTGDWEIVTPEKVRGEQ